MHTVGSVKNPTSTLSRTYVCRRWFVLCVPSPIIGFGRDRLPGGPQRASHDSRAPGGPALPLLAFSFFSFDRVPPAALSFSKRPLFWMQDRWPSLRCIFVKKFSERWSTRQTSRHDVAGKRLGFHDCDVRLTGNR